MAKITAVIDIGSNSARMAIYERTSRFSFHLVHEMKSRVRISEGSYDLGGMLQIIPMQRTALALKEFHDIAKSFKCRKVLCVATSAIRDAPNKLDFIKKVREEINLNIRVIDGQKEAFYSAVACLNLGYKKNALCIDVGGGSTEISLIEEGRIKDVISLNLGTIRLKELFSKNDFINLKEAKIFIEKELNKIPKSFINNHNVTYGIGGSFRAIAKLIMKKIKYPLKSIHGFEFNFHTHKKIFNDIYMSDIKRLKDLGIGKDREDSIREGILIVNSLIEYLKLNTIVTSGVGVREGVFLSDLLRNNNYIFPENFNCSHRSLMDRFVINNNPYIPLNAAHIFKYLSPLHQLDNRYLTLLIYAAKLINIGASLNYYLSTLHSSYFILHGLNYGYSHADKVIIYLIIKYIGKKNIEEDPMIASMNLDSNALWWLCFMLSLADALSIYEASYMQKDNIFYIKTKSFIAKEKIIELTSAILIKDINLEIRLI